MRDLTQPSVLLRAAVASLLTTTAAIPRLELWADALAAKGQGGSTPAFAAVLAWAAFFLWAFVFAWCERARGLRVWPAASRDAWRAPVAAALAGLAAGGLAWTFVDPALRPLQPAAYPTDLPAWWAHALFAIGFNLLFLHLAPFAFFLRLSGRKGVAVGCAILFAMVLLLFKAGELPAELPLGAKICVLLLRPLSVGVSLFLFQRGGWPASALYVLAGQIRLLP